MEYHTTNRMLESTISYMSAQLSTYPVALLVNSAGEVHFIFFMENQSPNCGAARWLGHAPTYGDAYLLLIVVVYKGALSDVVIVLYGCGYVLHPAVWEGWGELHIRWLVINAPYQPLPNPIAYYCRMQCNDQNILASCSWTSFCSSASIVPFSKPLT